jgi:hypothetical protein
MRTPLITVSLAGALALVLAGEASAATLGLTIGTAPSFTVTLDGTDQTPAFSLGMTATFTNGAFNITASATSFTVSTYALAPPTVTGVVTLACTGGGCVTPTNTITTYPTLLTAAAQKIYSASATAKGTVPLTANLTLSVPGNSFSGAYVSTLTLTIVSGP